MIREASAGLYVHVPFCLSKCPYCAFRSGTDLAGVPGYLTALRREAETIPAGFRRFDTLYLGGGTPTVLPDRGLAELLDGLRTVLPLDAVGELTLEANPADVTPGRARHWFDQGIDRISLGIQSLDDRDLAFLGRRHDARGALRAAQTLRKAGCANLSLDLIVGLPDRGAAHLERLLREALALEPEHLSVYQLTVEPGTPLAAEAERGVALLPGEDEVADLLLLTHRILTGAGYLHYEISSYARSPELRSRHNLKYWSHAPYLGLGPAAHSFLAGRRWWNVPTLREYLETQGRDRSPAEGSEWLTAGDLRRERILLGLRTDRGVALTDLAGRELGGLVEQGLLTLQEDRAIPTARGMLLADGLARELA